PTATFICRRRRARRGAGHPPEVADGLWVAWEGLWVAAATGRYTVVRLTAGSITRVRRLRPVRGRPAPHQPYRTPRGAGGRLAGQLGCPPPVAPARTKAAAAAQPAGSGPFQRGGAVSGQGIIAAGITIGGFKWTGNFTAIDLIAAGTNALNGALLAR